MQIFPKGIYYFTEIIGKKFIERVIKEKERERELIKQIENIGNVI